jgi:hypothetical protein
MQVLTKVTALVVEGRSKLVHDVLTERNLAADKGKLVTRFIGSSIFTLYLFIG